MASILAEELLTQLTLDDTRFQAGARRVVATIQGMIGYFNALKTASAGSINFGQGNAFNFMRISGGGGMGGGGGFGGGGGGGGGFFGGGFGGGMGGGFGNYFMLYGAIRVFRDVERAIIDVDKKLIDFGKDALQQYASFDTLTRSFTAIYGSGQKAGQMMTYLRDIAMKSAFHFRDLADAARGLAVSGIDVNRFLPVVQGFALAMGNISGGGLEDFVSILRRIQGGNIGFALGPRGIGRYGVSRDEMRLYGAQFGGPNQSHFIGTIDQAFDVVEKVFKARIEKIGQQVTASSEVVLSNLGDAWQQFTIDVGAGLMQNLIDPIKTLTASMNTLRQAGVFQNLGDTLATILGFDRFSGGGDPDLAGKRWNRQQGTWEKQNDKGDWVATTGPTHKSLATGREQPGRAWDPNDPTSWMGPSGGADNPTTYLIKIASGIVTLVALETLVVENIKGMAQFLLTPQGLKVLDANSPLALALKAGEDFQKTSFMQLYNNQQDRILHPEKYLAPNAPGGNEIPGLGDAASETADNTRAMRVHLEKIAQHMSDHAYGGGDVGKYGVTPVELSQLVKATGSNSKYKGMLNIDAISDMIDEKVMRILAGYARNRAFG